MQKNLMKLLLGSSALLMAAACDNTKTASVDEAAVEISAADYEAVANAAVNNPDRWPDDAASDESRNPGETLAFMKVAPGMSVFEVEAGGGYFTELFSLAVGPEGSVVMQNPEGFLAFVGDEITARLADNRLANVRDSISLFDDLDAEDSSMDLVTWVLGPHDLYYLPEDGSTLGDPAGSFAEIFRITKPGAAFVVIDHSAIEGSPEITGNTLHRIDQALVVAMAEAAGFVSDSEGGFLAESEDDRTTHVFSEDIRGNTDQFAIRFRRPE
jgi:predicted methyltransferase